MQKVLSDIIRYTHDLGEIEAFKLITDSEGKSVVKSSSKDLSIIFEAKIKENMPALVQKTKDDKTTIGFSRLNVLAGYVKSPVFNNDNATLKLEYREDGSPRELVFKSDMGHTCTYRMMAPEIAKQKIRTHSLVIPIENFDIIFQPAEQFVKDLQAFSGILSKFNANFTFSVDSGVLYMNLGEDDTARIPVMKTEVESVNTMNSWPTKQVLGILRQAPDLDSVTVHICDSEGLIDIHVDTEFATYSYKLPAAQ